MRDNIAFGRADLSDEEVERVARAAQAHEFIERLPKGYETLIGERGITLSGGQRQRVAIARALAVDPRILILDDATASVDATTEARIREGLREAMRDRTTLIVAHRLSTIALADEIVVLDGGRVAARGTHEELARTSPVYREIREHGLLERQFTEAVEARAGVEEVRVSRVEHGHGRGLNPDTSARDEGRLGRERTGDRVRVHQAGSHLTQQRGAEVQDWSWRQTRRRIGDALAPDDAVPAAAPACPSSRS